MGLADTRFSIFHNNDIIIIIIALLKVIVTAVPNHSCERELVVVYWQEGYATPHLNCYTHLHNDFTAVKKSRPQYSGISLV